MNRTKAAMTEKPAKKKAKKKSSGKRVHKMHISRTANDKFNVEHEFEQAPGQMPQPNETHGINDLQELQDHVAEHMGDNDGDEAPAPEPGM